MYRVKNHRRKKSSPFSILEIRKCKGRKFKFFSLYFQFCYSSCISTFFTHLWGRGEFAKRWHYSISLFSKMPDKGGGRGQKSQKMGDVIFGRPLNSFFAARLSTHLCAGKKNISKHSTRKMTIYFLLPCFLRFIISFFAFFVFVRIFFKLFYVLYGKKTK